MRVLVTGGAGFIGSHLVALLAERGFKVRVLDNFSRSSVNLEDLGGVEVVIGDVRDYDVVSKATRGVDVVVHLAALTDASESLEIPGEYLEVNVGGTLNICRAARGVKSLIYASSAAVYGDAPVPVNEESPTRPISPYGASKLAGEAYVWAYSRVNEYKPVVLRLFNVYGPRQSRGYAGVISEFVRRAVRGLDLIVYGDGLRTRDFIHVRDVVELIAGIVERGGVSGVYNIGSGAPVRIIDLAHMVIRVAGSTSRIVHGPPRPGDIRYSQADISRAVRELGFKPRVALEDGLRELVELEKLKLESSGS